MFFFGSYEGYRLDAGVNFVEAAPSASAWARAVPAIAQLRPGFTSPNAVILPGASANPDFDIYQLQSLEEVRENSFSARLDMRMNQNWGAYFRLFRDSGEQLRPEGISGRVVNVTSKPTNAIFNLAGDKGIGDFGLRSMFVAFVGACLLLLVVGAITGRGRGARRY